MDLRAHALEVLATPRADHRFYELPAEVARRAGSGAPLAMMTLWTLLSEGLVFPLPGNVPNTSPEMWEWRLTERGIAAVNRGPWRPHDPDGYLRRLRRAAPDIDPKAMPYIEEALATFNAQCYIASTVMIGVASERVVLGVAEAMVKVYGDEVHKLKQALASPGKTQQSRFEALQGALEPRRNNLPEGLADKLTLDGVAELLRLSRNDAGHPTGIPVDEDTARTRLELAGVYLARMTALRRHFDELAAAAEPT